MLSPYRDILATPGAKTWTLAGFVARLPISMVTLAMVLLIAGRTGSYGFAGVVCASYLVPAACSAPLLARLIDLRGQAEVLLPGVVIFSVALLGLIGSIERSWPTPVPHVFAALAGIAYPPVGSCVRARWAAALGGAAGLHTAYSLEAVVDEAIFMAGPVLVTVLATTVSEVLGVGAVVVFALSGGLWLAGQHSTEPPRRTSAGGRGATEQLGWTWLVMVVLGAVCLGTLFGATEVVTVAFAAERGHRNLAGVLLAVWAAGSLIAGLVNGSVQWAVSPLRRYRLGALGMAAVMLPLPLVKSIPVLAVVLFLAGFAISPTLVAVVSMVQQHVPASRLTEGITWIMTGIGLGIAPGAALAGRLIDEYGASTAYLVPAVGGVLAAAVAALTPVRRSSGGRPVETIAGAPHLSRSPHSSQDRC